MEGKRRLLGLTTGVLCALAPAVAHGSVTIGPNLDVLTPGGTYNCGADNECTLRNRATTTASAGGLISPVNGRVTSFVLRTGAAGASDVTFRVLRPSGTAFLGAGSLGPRTAPPSSTTPFSASLPIKAGDSVGLNCCRLADDAVTVTQAGGAFDVWGGPSGPPLADGQSLGPQADQPDSVVMLNAVVEPGNDYKLKKPKRRGRKVIVRVTTENPGTVVIANGSFYLKKKWTRYVRARSFEVDSAGTHRLVLRLSAIGRSAVEREGKEGARIAVRFQPRFGGIKERWEKTVSVSL